MAGRPEFQVIVINVTAYHIRICRVLRSGSSSHFKLQEPMFPDLHAEECDSEPQFFQGEFKWTQLDDLPGQYKYTICFIISRL